MASRAFLLTKWYMDCVDAAGDAAIVYCATMRWRGLSVSMASVLEARGGAAETRTSIAHFQVTAGEGEIAVEAAALDLAGMWRAGESAFEKTVYEGQGGAVVWSCLQPRSQVALRIGGRELSGLGYAERLTMTVAPWRLPMRELRWGRFVSEKNSLAWIDWRGEHTARFAVLNGCECELESATESEVRAGGARLRIDEGMTLRSGRLGETILPGAPALGKLFSRSVFGVREQKWLSRGTLASGSESVGGNVIHEVVHWGA